MAREAFSYRSDPAVPSFPDDRPILIFDGNCVLCSSFVQFILRTDRKRRFRLLAAQTPIGAALYRHLGLNPTDYETNILIEDGRAWLKSEGSIRVFERLGFPWSLMAAGRLLPGRCGLALRDRRAQPPALVRREANLLPARSRPGRSIPRMNERPQVLIVGG